MLKHLAARDFGDPSIARKRKGKPSAKVTKSAFITQVATKPPVFALFVGHPQDITAGVRAVSGEPVARDLRIFGYAHAHFRQEKVAGPCEAAFGLTPPHHHG